MNNALNLPEIDQEQAANLSKFFIRSQKNLFLFGRRGVGKMLDLETELPTPKGFVKLKNLKQGDQLFDENGNICNVIKLHPIDYNPESYQITFDDGTIVKACADHLWLTWDKKARKNKNIKPKVRTTKEIFSSLKTNTLKKETNHSITTTLPINYPVQDLPIDPYVLGCWLGDGRCSSGSIECADDEILKEIEFAGYSVNKTSNINSLSKSSNYRIGNLIDSGSFNHSKIGKLKQQLKQLDLIDNKHIPDIYMHSSYKQRLSLLQGLLDTDGCCLKNGKIEYCSVIQTLANQVWLLANSLGIKAHIYKNKSCLYGKRYQDRYRVYFITKLPVFRLKRKLQNIKKSPNQDRRNTHRYIINVEKINPIPMRCITVDSPSHLYLITRSFIPTHNTEIIMQAAKDCNVKMNYINLSVIERPDLAGYPDMNVSGDVVSFKSPCFLPSLGDDEESDRIILFDEVDKAPVEVTAPLLEILQFKKINGKRINVASCILTGNLINEGANSNLVSSALLDRGAKYILTFNFEKWVDWAKAHDMHDLILGFLRSNPEFACGKVDDTHYASPSPRSWTLASEALNQARTLKITDIDSVVQIISGFVGSEAGLRFKIWYEHYRKFEPFVLSLIELGSMNLNYHELAPTEKVIFVVTACYFAKHKTLKELNKSKNKFYALENLCNFLVNNKVDHEVQVMGLYNSFDFEMITKHKLYECNQFFELFSKLNENIVIKK
jgi:hypothetical protein